MDTETEWDDSMPPGAMPSWRPMFLLLVLLSPCLTQPMEAAAGAATGIFRSWKQMEVDGGDSLDRDLKACRLGHSGDPAKCGQVEYVSAVYKEWQKLQAAGAKERGGEGVITQIQAINSTTSFPDFFVKFAVTKRPVKILSTGKSVLAAATEKAAKACIIKAEEEGVALADKCPEVLEAAMVPRFIANDYTQRLRTSDKSAISSFIDRYPVLSRGVEVGSTSPLHSCPSSGQLLLALHDGALDVKAFSPKQGPYLQPEPGDGAWLHHFRYAADVWDPQQPGSSSNSSRSATTITPSSSSLSASVASLLPGDMLFVPHNWLVSWRFQAPGSVVSFCYMDASNLNAVKAALALESHVSTESKHVLEALNGAEVDTSMERDAHDMQWKSFATWPRKNNKVSEEDKEGDSGAGQQQQASRSNRRKNFKAWQSTNRWNFMVLGLTLPAPSTPLIRSVGRHNATVEWTTPFIRKTDDKAMVTYVVSWHAHKSRLARAAPGRNLDGNMTVREQDLHQEIALDDPRVGTGLQVNLYQLTIQGLEPDTIYKVQVRVMYGEAEGPWSMASRAFTTQPFTLPQVPAHVSIKDNTATATTVTLVVHPPMDDGGLPIQQYIIWKRNTEQGFREGWALAGNVTATSLPFVVVKNLFPDVVYVFKVAAVNAVGIGPQTHDTAPPVRTQGRIGLAADKTLHLGGHGHTAAVEENPHGVLGPVITIDDSAQTVTLLESEDKEVIEVWAAHWSPKHYKVTAEAVWTEPRNAAGAITNAAQVAHRIAVVERGEVPLLRKAAEVQAVGGMGIVIMDNGLCTKGFDQFCCPGADKSRHEGLAGADDPEPWSRIRIPVVLMRPEDAKRFLETMHDSDRQEEGGQGRAAAAAAAAVGSHQMHDEL